VTFGTAKENPLPLKEPEKISNGIRRYRPTNGTPSMGAQWMDHGGGIGAGKCPDVESVGPVLQTGPHAVGLTN